MPAGSWPDTENVYGGLPPTANRPIFCALPSWAVVGIVVVIESAVIALGATTSDMTCWLVPPAPFACTTNEVSVAVATLPWPVEKTPVLAFRVNPFGKPFGALQEQPEPLFGAVNVVE